VSRLTAVVAVAVLAVAASACGKQQQPKVDAEAERKAAHDRAAKDAFGTQVQALDQAKAMQEDLNKKAEERGAAADSMSK